ncbi:MAG: hypothetical protein EZS28_015323 [Streblomastix strix]|uniref:Uncharacterized protein n=1 Tax=Streblomastix strix TaxID=222440 RepID=A0A5J4W2U2_9EUKA|nr:MAG: hypothetical protein EZS28_015323 [Streblomastix strix]
MVYSIVEHIEYAELFRSSFCSGVRGIVLAQSSSEIFTTCGFGDIRLWHLRSVISGWSDGKIRSFEPESGRIQHVLAMRTRSGVSEGQIQLWKLNPDNQQIVAMRKEYVVALTAVCNAGRS